MIRPTTWSHFVDLHDSRSWPFSTTIDRKHDSENFVVSRYKQICVCDSPWSRVLWLLTLGVLYPTSHWMSLSGLSKRKNGYTNKHLSRRWMKNMIQKTRGPPFAIKCGCVTAFGRESGGLWLSESCWLDHNGFIVITIDLHFACCDVWSIVTITQTSMHTHTHTHILSSTVLSGTMKKSLKSHYNREPLSTSVSWNYLKRYTHWTKLGKHYIIGISNSYIC